MTEFPLTMVKKSLSSSLQTHTNKLGNKEKPVKLKKTQLISSYTWTVNDHQFAQMIYFLVSAALDTEEVIRKQGIDYDPTSTRLSFDSRDDYIPAERRLATAIYAMLEELHEVARQQLVTSDVFAKLSIRHHPLVRVLYDIGVIMAKGESLSGGLIGHEELKRRIRKKLERGVIGFTKQITFLNRWQYVVSLAILACFGLGCCTLGIALLL